MCDITKSIKVARWRQENSTRERKSCAIHDEAEEGAQGKCFRNH